MVLKSPVPEIDWWVLQWYFSMKYKVHLSATATKNQFYFFLIFQNYVTEPLSDRSFKPPF